MKINEFEIPEQCVGCVPLQRLTERPATDSDQYYEIVEMLRQYRAPVLSGLIEISDLPYEFNLQAVASDLHVIANCIQKASRRKVETQIAIASILCDGDACYVLRRAQRRVKASDHDTATNDTE
ncbi:MAG TPA: hypothetical protein VF572_02895 [Candidatus Saccharimonadales bacterium]|jgi:hypothetical protein